MINAASKEGFKALVRIFLICRPSFLDVSFQLSKEFLNGIKMVGAWPVWIWGDLAVPNCRMFFRIFVIERSENSASLAICDVVRIFLLCII
jgi:hypothetical protein